jgi:hypothetical protein
MNRSVNGMGGKKEQETEIEQAIGFQFLVCSALLCIVPWQTATTLLSLLSNKHRILTCFSYLRTPKSETTSKQSRGFLLHMRICVKTMRVCQCIKEFASVDTFGLNFSLLEKK